MVSPAERIVSFLPSATEILYELGIGNKIVGVTHECNFPADSMRKPRVIRSSFEATKLSANEIDGKLVELMNTGESIFVIDDKALIKANPDLIIAQGLCEVCAPFSKEINRAINILRGKPDVLILDPRDLDDILVSIMDIAQRVDRVKEGCMLVASLQKRIDGIRSKSKYIRIKPTVVCIEWLDPLFTAGHWVPQMVEIAGGINGISRQAEQSRRMSIIEILDFNPDIIVLMPCGFDLDRTLQEASWTFAKNKEWRSIKAVKNHRLYAVDAGSYFSKPGPRTIVGLEILAKIINPKETEEIMVSNNSFKRITIRPTYNRQM